MGACCSNPSPPPNATAITIVRFTTPSTLTYEVPGREGQCQALLQTVTYRCGMRSDLAEHLTATLAARPAWLLLDSANTGALFVREGRRWRSLEHVIPKRMAIKPYHMTVAEPRGHAVPVRIRG